MACFGDRGYKEEEEIKQAYRSRLVSTNRRRIRKALRGCARLMRWLWSWRRRRILRKWSFRRGPVGDWLMEIRDVYNWLPSRIDEKVWKELLENDVCVSLETMLDAREALLKFLTDHFRLPGNIWKIVDEKLSLQEDMEDLQRRFPMDF